MLEREKERKVGMKQQVYYYYGYGGHRDSPNSVRLRY